MNGFSKTPQIHRIQSTRPVTPLLSNTKQQHFPQSSIIIRSKSANNDFQQQTDQPSNGLGQITGSTSNVAITIQSEPWKDKSLPMMQRLLLWKEHNQKESKKKSTVRATPSIVSKQDTLVVKSFQFNYPFDIQRMRESIMDAQV